MPAAEWRSIVQEINDGENVDAQVTNRAIRALEERSRYLRERLEALDPESGRSVISNAPVDSGVSEGDWVYFDTSNLRFDQALARMELSGGAYIPSESSNVVGMVISKESAEIGNIMILGGNIDLIDQLGISDLTDLLETGQAFEAGRYFLSSTDAGKMSPAPGAPLVSLGYFSDNSSYLSPVLFQGGFGHQHRRFPLEARPSPTQDSEGDGFSEHASGEGYYADYYWRSGGGTSRIAMAIRVVDPTVSMPDTRITIENFGGSLLYSEFTGVDLDDPDSTGTPGDAFALSPMPDYGEWVRLADGSNFDWGVEIAFFRTDGLYPDTLANDLSTNLPSAETDGRWQIAPDRDYVGWTNANPLDSNTPSGAKLRYIHEGTEALNSSWPPNPVESAAMFLNGALVDEDHFLADYWGIYWKDNELQELPWGADYTHAEDSSSTEDADPVYSYLFFNLAMGRAAAAVTSLKSASPFLEITSCEDGQPATAGDLQIDFNLGFSTEEAAASAIALAGVSEDGQRFLTTSSVAELLAGPGISLQRVDADGNSVAGDAVGRVRVTSTLSQEGPFGIISLDGGKERRKNGLAYVELLKPADGASGFFAQFRVPSQIGGTASLNLKLLAFGEAAASPAALAVLKVSYRVAKTQTGIASALVAAQRVEAFRLAFPDGYTAFQILDTELPTLDEKFPRTPSSEEPNLSGLEPGDIVSVQIARDSNNPAFACGDTSGSPTANDFAADDYDASIGIAGLRWELSLE